MKCKCIIATLVIGLILLVLAVIAYFVLPYVVHKKVSEMLPLKKGSFVYEQWQKSTVPIYMQFWFFTVDNPAEVLEGQKPALIQVGPYTYREERFKYNITFHPNGSVSYRQNRLFFFDRSRSVGDENDTLTALNIPLVVMGNMLKSFPKFVRVIATGIIHSFDNYGLFFTTSVGNLTWGYLDPVLDRLMQIYPSLVPGGDPHIGLLYRKNNTDDLEYTVDAGLSPQGVQNFLAIQAWNGSSSLSIWDDRYANMVNGTDGSMLSPFISRKSRIYTYQSDICRSIYGTIDDTDGLPNAIKGIPALNFAAPDEVFANETENPANRGFCVDGYCTGAGVLNLTRCAPPGTPLVMSQPHFLSAAPHFLTDVHGMTPSPDCRTSLSVEPLTGIPLKLQKKLQLNIAIDPIEDFMGLDRLHAVVLPVAWLNESMLINDELASMLRAQLVLPMTIGKWLTIALFVSGVLMMLGSILAAAVRIHSLRAASPRSSPHTKVDANDTAYHIINSDTT